MRYYLILVVLWCLPLLSYGQTAVHMGYGSGSGQASLSNGDATFVMSGGQVVATEHKKVSLLTEVVAGMPADIAYFPVVFPTDVFASKGYYSDYVQLDWDILALEDRIDRIRIFRKVLGSDSDSIQIANLDPTVYSYQDQSADATVLYKYTIFAQGIADGLMIPYVNFVEVVGFSFPFGTVSGAITYEGGNAVEGVTILAEATNSTLSGSSIRLDGSTIRIESGPDDQELHLDSAFTLQMWTRYAGDGSAPGTILSRGRDVSLTYDGDTLAFQVKNAQVKLPYKSKLDTFFHISAVFHATDGLKLMVNERGDTTYTATAAAGQVPDDHISVIYLGRSDTLTGNHYNGWLDEIRFWDFAMGEELVLRDFDRILSGTESGLVGYYRADEGFGGYIYDISREGFTFFENHGRMIDVQWSDAVPTQSQLGYKGITDESGAYLISGFPYETNGTLYKFTPIFENHSFNPIQQTRFVGDGASIFNEVDFEDVSSFPVSGHVRYRDMPFPVEGVSILIDNAVATDEDGLPVVTDAKGDFTVDVPIGFHHISLRRTGHGFEGGGRFPALGATPDKFDFQAPLAGLEFVDTTLVKMAGRVVGGPVEAGKPLGFGLSKNNIGNATITMSPKKLADLTFDEVDVSRTVDEGGHFESTTTFNLRNITIEADEESGEYVAMLPPEEYVVNSITTKNYTFGDSYHVGVNLVFTPGGEDTRADTLIKTVQGDTLFFQPKPVADYDSVVTINIADTTYRVALDTFRYDLKQDFVLRVTPSIEVEDPFLEGTFGDTVYTYTDDNLGISTDLALINRNKPDSLYTLGYPAFSQRGRYRFKISLFEEYLDELGNTDEVPVVDGSVRITNELAINTEPTTLALNSSGFVNYDWVAGLPNIAEDPLNPANTYTKPVSITAFSGNNGSIRTVWRESDPFRGFVLGSLPTGNNFVTTGPNQVMTILRDPPGSGSTAFIEKGRTTSRTANWGSSTGFTREFGVSTSFGSSTKTITGAGGGIAGVFSGQINEVEVVNDVSVGLEASAGFEYEGAQTSSMTFNQEISTSDELVGSDGDLFVGYSTNIVYGLSKNLTLIPEADCTEGCLDTDVPGYKLGIDDGIRVNPEFNTFFLLSQFTIENLTVPNLRNIRNSFLTYSTQPDTISPVNDPVYVSLIPEDDPRYGTSNADEVWGDSATLNIGEGPSYIIKVPDGYLEDNEFTDTVLYYNTQIDGWEYWLAHNERAKLEAELDKNISFDGSGSITESITTEVSQENAFQWSTSLSTSLSNVFDTEVSIFGVALGLEIENTATLEVGGSGGFVNETENSTTYGYTLEDGDLGDTYTVDVKKPEDGFGAVFATRGGATSCPYEGAEVTEYYNPGTELHVATAQREVPDITVDNAVVTDVPDNRQAVYTLNLSNFTETNDGFEFGVGVVQGSNPMGAAVSFNSSLISGSGVIVNVPANQTVTATLSIAPNAAGDTDYENIGIVMYSLCQNDPNDNLPEIADTVYVSAYFVPGCSDIAFDLPTDNWVVNTRVPVEDVLGVAITNYDLNELNFERIDFQYRPVGTSQWFTDMKFYNPQTVSQDQFDSLDAPKQMIEGSEVSYDFNMAALPNRGYEVQAVTRCVPGPGVEYSTPTEIMTGVKDTKRPKLFGSPQPADGILSADDEIRIEFDEEIQAGLLLSSDFAVTGVLNSTELTNGVSVSFDGVDDYVRIPNATLGNSSFTVFSWFRRENYGQEQVLFSQGSAADNLFEYGFTPDDKIFVNFSGQRLESVASFPDPGIGQRPFEWVSVIVDQETNKLFVYRNGEFVIDGADLANPFLGETPIMLGKSALTDDRHFTGNMHELRIWSRERSLGDEAAFANLGLSGNEIGLMGYWPMDEANGTLLLDKARSRSANSFAGWTVEPKGHAYTFDGVDDYVKINTASTVIISDEQDFTLEMWFKGAPQGEAVLFSNGKGDGTEEVANSEDTWFVGFDANNHLVVSNNLNQVVVDDKVYLDDDWHHVAIALNRLGNLNVFVDAERKASAPAADFGGLLGFEMWLGARGYRPNNVETEFDRHFNGQIDEVRFWNTFKRASQIELNWNSKVQGDEIGLVGYYPFEAFEIMSGIQVLQPSLADQWQNPFGPNGGMATSNGGADFISDNTANIKLARPVQKVDFDYAVRDNAIIITPSSSFDALIEQTVLEISLRTVEDLFENRLASPVAWTAFVDRAPVKWGESALDLAKEVYEPMQFEVEVINRGGTEQTFSITNLPAWLTVSENDIAIAPASVKTITFTVSEGLNVGSYEEDIFLSSEFGFNEKMSLALRVYSPAPDWTFDPSEYQYSMNVVAQLSIDNVFSTDVFDQVAAFIDGELRGSAHIEYEEIFDTYQLYLTVYSNNPSGEDIELRVWDASTGTEFREGVTPDLTFVTNGLEGNPANPITIAVSNTVLQQIPLNQGWSWVSFAVESNSFVSSDSLLRELNGATGNQIKSVNAADIFNEGIGWRGSLTATGGYTNGEMYKFFVDRDTLSVVGTPVDVANSSIDLIPGWNWIGFTPRFNQPINEALSSLQNATPGDIIKSQFLFAVYVENAGWIGTLEFLAPNQGYLLNSANADVLRYPVASSLGGRLGKNMRVKEVHDYENSMNLIGTVIGLDNAMDYEIVPVDENGSRRGTAHFRKVGGEQLLFVNILGSDGGIITFEARDLTMGDVVVADIQVPFINNLMIGGLDDPQELDFGSGLTPADEGMSVYPNPFSEQTHILISGLEEVKPTITVMDITGKEIIKLDAKYEGNAWQAVWDGISPSGEELPAGIYLIRSDAGGMIQNTKVILEK